VGGNGGLPGIAKSGRGRPTPHVGARGGVIRVSCEAQDQAQARPRGPAADSAAPAATALRPRSRHRRAAPTLGLRISSRGLASAAKLCRGRAIAVRRGAGRSTQVAG
jgi:hypothetical protein